MECAGGKMNPGEKVKFNGKDATVITQVGGVVKLEQGGKIYTAHVDELVPPAEAPAPAAAPVETPAPEAAPEETPAPQMEAKPGQTVQYRGKNAVVKMLVGGVAVLEQFGKRVSAHLHEIAP